MDKLLPSLILGGVVALVVLGMLLGWRARVSKYSRVEALGAVPESIGNVLAVCSGLYVATTLAGNPLERFAAHKLGFRAKATVTVGAHGVVVVSVGRDPYFIARNLISAVGRATWAIDKAVEPGGLALVTWRLGKTDLDSYFRMDAGTEEFVEAITELIEGAA